MKKNTSPKFDIQEDEHSYNLQGELPGVEKENVEIEWNDPQVCFFFLFVIALYHSSLLIIAPSNFGSGGNSSSGRPRILKKL